VKCRTLIFRRPPTLSHSGDVAGFSTNSYSFFVFGDCDGVGVVVVDVGGGRRRNEVENIAAVIQSNMAA